MPKLRGLFLLFSLAVAFAISIAVPVAQAQTELSTLAQDSNGCIRRPIAAGGSK